MTNWTDNGYLYHYTSAHSVLGIIRSRKIWATQIDFLNDGLDSKIISELLTTMADHPEIYFRPATTGIQAIYIDALRCHLRTDRLTFVASFSRAPNVLTQFRMYCPPSGGFVIGFPREYLERVGRLIDIDYDRDNHVSWCKEFFTKYMQAAASDYITGMTAEDLASKMERTVRWRDIRVGHAPGFKNAEFAFEQEVRLIGLGDPILVRAAPNGSLAIPYVEVDLPNEPIRVHIAAGPGKFAERLVRSSEGAFHWAAKAANTVWNINQIGIGKFGFRDLS